jgi:Ca-activated chloride channel homolog
MLFLVCAASARPAERPLNALTIPAGVEFVNVNVSVLNTKDRFVTDLGREDFVVLEDGVPQEMSLFAQKELPVSLVLLLDMSASMTANVKAVRSAAQRLIAKLDPDDEVQVAQFNQGLRVLQTFTSDKHALDDAIRAAKPSGATALHNSLYITLKDIMRDGPPRDLRRRAIVLLSDGEDTASMVTDEQVMELARAAEISIYSIKIGVPGFDREAFGEQARYLLNALARESGGEAYFPTELSRLAGIYDRIGQELHSQYSIGYVPSNTRFDGAWRQILVITARQGVTLRHRLGYYAANGSRRSSGETGLSHARSARLP